MAPSILSDFMRRLGRYERITGMSKIARRYFVMNAFDGALTMFGLIIGSYLAGVREPGLVFAVGISTAIAIGMSGLWGAFLTESAERKRDLKDLEKLMLRKLSNSYQAEATRSAAYMAALIDAFSPALAGFVILLPFLLAHAGVSGMTINKAYATSISLSFGVFFLLGAYLGRISKESIWGYGLKMLFAGVLSALLIYALSAAGLVSAAA
ncbi:MAG: VIT1/CCC1 transporter family protein [Candidatus Micrarchaeia archaeon]|jgi:predicted membrane protein (TIGR00267 family)